MKEKTLSLSVGREKYKVTLTAQTVSNGMVLTIFGGEKPHVGAVALAVPRPSLRNRSKISATSSVITLVGHKDDMVARPSAELLAKKSNKTVVVVAGIHIRNATRQQVGILLSNCRKAVKKLISKLPAS